MPVVGRTLACAIVSAVVLCGLDNRLQLSQYTKRHWHVEDGLPQNYVTSLVQTGDGYLLVGTGGGVSRFDGVRFTQVPIDAARGVVREWVEGLALAPDGTLYLSARDSGTYQQSRAASRFEPTLYNSMLAARDGWVWGLGPQLRRWRAGGEPEAVADITSKDLSWQAIEEDKDGNVWAISRQGMFQVVKASGDVLRAQRIAGTPEGMMALRARRRGGLWVGTTSGLYRYEPPSRWTRVAGVAGLVVNILEDRDELLWVATWGRGLYRVNGERVDRWTMKEGALDDFVHSMLEDREGNLWIATRSGLARWKNSRLIPYGIPEGLGGQFAAAIAEDRSGRLLLATGRTGIWLFHDESIRKLRVPLQDLNLWIQAIATDHLGGFWAATPYLSLRSSLGPAAAVRTWGQHPRAILVDDRGSLWFGGDRGLYEYPGGTPEGDVRVHLKARVNCILRDRDGTIWAGTDRGAAHVASAGTTTFGRKDGLPDEFITSVSEDATGRVWITTRANGIVVRTPGGWRAIDQRNGLPAQPFYRVLDDGSGSLWLTSPSGIFELRSEQVEALLKGTRSSLEVTPFGVDDGLRTRECSNVGQPSSWRARDGSLWFATVGGFARLRPDSKRQVQSPAPVIIEELEAGGVQIPPGETIRLRPGTRDVLVRYTSPSLASPEKVEFRHRISGLSTEWSVPSRERTLRIAPLPPGAHTIQVAARFAGGEWQTSTATVAVEQLPRIYQSVWFQALAATMLASIGLALYRWRLHLLRTRYSAVLAERSRIAREWHDTLLAGFSAVSWQLDTTARRIESNPERALEAVDVAKKILNHYRTEARRVIWDLKSDEIEGEGLPAVVRRALSEIGGETLQTRLGVCGNEYPLDAELAQNALRICQEAAANAVRHGGATILDVALEYQPKQIVLTIADDGCGFDVSLAQRAGGGNFGLTIMRERARRFGGTLEITSVPGQGTTVKAVLPTRSS